LEHRRRQHREYFQRRRAGLVVAARHRTQDENDEDPRVVAALKARDRGDLSLIEQLLAK